MKYTNTFHAIKRTLEKREESLAHEKMNTGKNNSKVHTSRAAKPKTQEYTNST